MSQVAARYGSVYLGDDMNTNQALAQDASRQIQQQSSDAAAAKVLLAKRNKLAPAVVDAATEEPVAAQSQAEDQPSAQAPVDTGSARVADAAWVYPAAEERAQGLIQGPVSYLSGVVGASSVGSGGSVGNALFGSPMTLAVQSSLVNAPVVEVIEGSGHLSSADVGTPTPSIPLAESSIASVSTGQIASVAAEVTSRLKAAALKINGIVDNSGAMRVLYSDGATLGDTTPVLSGVAGANLRIVVRDKASGTTLGLATTDANGAWSLELPSMTTGRHEVVVQTIAADRQETSLSFQISDTSAALVKTASTSTLQVTGWEDSAYVFSTNDLNGLRQSTGINLISEIVINQLPTEGTLQFLNANKQWVAVTAGQSISTRDFRAGGLRFVPDANESGSSFFNAPGVGNKKNIYAEIDLDVVGASAASSNGDVTLQMVINPLTASLGAGKSVSRSVTTYETVATQSTMYRTILDDTRVSGDSVGHDWRIRYKLSNGQEGDIDINDSKGWTDGNDRVVYQGSQHVGVTDLMLYQSGKSSLWLSQKNGGFNYTNVSNIGLEDCYGIFGWGWFSDWNDGYVSVRVESFQQQTGTTQRATTTTVQDTQFGVNVSNASQYAKDNPNACFNIVLTGGSNYQLRDASDKVLMTGAGTFQATVTQINAGLKVHVFNGGSAPSVDTRFVSTTSPLVIDLNGDGVHTIAVDDGVAFDIDASGHAKQVGWVDANDGLLVLDLNGNGHIDDGRELFGNHTALNAGGTAADGWQALAQYDVNLDGVISKADAVFDRLQIWVDANTDGVTDAGELHSLLSLGIASIGLQHDGSQTVQNGNLLSGLAQASTEDGAQLQVTDAWLQTRALDEQLAVNAAVVI